MFIWFVINNLAKQIVKYHNFILFIQQFIVILQS